MATSAPAGQYTPQAAGFNLAGVRSRAKLDSLPAGARAPARRGQLDPRAHARRPDARPGGEPQPGTGPTFAGSYTPADPGLDLIGIDPSPVRSELARPAYTEIGTYVRAAEAPGWPLHAIMPVYQTSGGGRYADDGNGHWIMPTAAEENQILAAWAAAVPPPLFDCAYSWGPQNGATALSQSAPCGPCSRTRTPSPGQRHEPGPGPGPFAAPPAAGRGPGGTKPI